MGFQGDRDWDKYMNTPDCPTCQSDLYVERLEDSDNIIKAGLYVCGKCGTSFVDDEEAEGAILPGDIPSAGPSGDGGDSADPHGSSDLPAAYPPPVLGLVSKED